jgi:fatty acid desaturase
MNATPSLEPINESYAVHWVSRAAFPVISAALVLAEVVLALLLYYNQALLAIPVVLVVSHLMHGQLIGFHEASHGLLRKNRSLNEFDGILIGIFSFMSFSLYRAAHQTHHMHLATPRDEELWPFVHLESPRWGRMLAALLELTLGLLFTPFIFLRSFFRDGSPIRSEKVRRRIWLELGLIVAVWGGVLAAVYWLNGWKYFLWMYLGPAMLAGNLQSWRKYIEHVGLTSSTLRGATRSVIAKGWLGRLVSLTLLHEPYHGVHHQHGGVPHAELPRYAADLEPTTPEEHAPFPSYHHALLHLLHSLADPRVGAQWQSTARAQS